MALTVKFDYTKLPELFEGADCLPNSIDLKDLSMDTFHELLKKASNLSKFIYSTAWVMNENHYALYDLGGTQVEEALLLKELRAWIKHNNPQNKKLPNDHLELQRYVMACSMLAKDWQPELYTSKYGSTMDWLAAAQIYMQEIYLIGGDIPRDDQQSSDLATRVQLKLQALDIMTFPLSEPKMLPAPKRKAPTNPRATTLPTRDTGSSSTYDPEEQVPTQTRQPDAMATMQFQIEQIQQALSSITNRIQMEHMPTHVPYSDGPSTAAMDPAATPKILSELSMRGY